MLISMAPLYLLFEFSVLLARFFGRPRDESADEPDDEPGMGGPHAPATG